MVPPKAELKGYTGLLAVHTEAPRHREQLLGLFAQPGSAAALDPAAWSDIVGTARNANLLGKLAATLEQIDSLPAGAPRRHLTGALMLSQRQAKSVVWEAHQIDEALAPLGVPVVLLKGAAYVLGGHPAAAGRLFGDIDILVERQALGDVEHHLMIHGWTPVKTDAYDQRYYRQWMHEIPPLIHARRGTVIDVHHTILPLTSAHRPVPHRIIEHARPVPGFAHLMTPCAEDLLVHSLCHLVHEGEVNNTLRDMHDIASLVRAGASKQGFPASLAAVAAEHDLLEPCALGLALVARYFPSEATLAASESMGVRSNRPDHEALIRRYDRALQPSPTGQAGLTAQLARALIYLRSHRLRMPPGMLVRHLSRKAWRRLTVHPQPAPPQE